MADHQGTGPNVELRPSPSPGRRQTAAWVAVATDGDDRIEVEVRRRRSPVIAHEVPAMPPAATESAHDHTWTQAQADAAAGRRWSQRDPGIATISSIDWQGQPQWFMPLLSLALAALHPEGIRRVDLRVDRHHRLAGQVVRPEPSGRWMNGAVDDDLVASLALDPPWRSSTRTQPAPRSDSELVRWFRRQQRRLSGARPTALPNLLATQAEELLHLARRRRPPARLATRAEMAALPPGSNPHAESRFRTIRRALDLVDDGRRSRPFLDIGSGSGRVLEVAADRGFSEVQGVEHDARLAADAQRRLGQRATVFAADALVHELPEDLGTLFLNNPFGVAMLESFARHLSDWMQGGSRDVLVLYLNPPSFDPLLAAGLSLVHVEPAFAVLASAPVRPTPMPPLP